MTDRPGDCDERLGRAPVLPLAELDRGAERTFGLCRRVGVRDTDGAEGRLGPRRMDDGRLSRGIGVEACLPDSCREDRSHETSSRRERGPGADTATGSAVRPGRGGRLDACKEGSDFFFPLDLGFDREPPLVFGRERDGFEGLAREGSDLRVGFVGLAREGSDLPLRVEALGRSRVCRGLAIFL